MAWSGSRKTYGVVNWSITYRSVIPNLVFPVRCQLLAPHLGSFWSSGSLFRSQNWCSSPSEFPLAPGTQARVRCSHRPVCWGSNPQPRILGEENALLGRGCVVEVGRGKGSERGQHLKEREPHSTGPLPKPFKGQFSCNKSISYPMVTPFSVCHQYLCWSFRHNPLKYLMHYTPSFMAKNPTEQPYSKWKSKYNIALTKSKLNSHSNKDMIFIFATKFNVDLAWNIREYALLVMNKKANYDRVPSGICHYKLLKSTLKYYKYPKELWLFLPLKTFYNVRAN